MIKLHEPSFDFSEYSILKKCIKQGWVSTAGNFINIFEKKIANFTGSKYAISCINGTSALQISMNILGIGKNDEVIAPSLTFIAPINAIKYNSANPIFIDNDTFYTIDTLKTIEFLEKHTKTKKINKSGNISYITINKKTGKTIKAIIVVHTFGNAVFLDDLYDTCKKKNIHIIEDAAESLGTVYTSGKFSQRHTGTIGSVGCLSFNGNKIITSGSGGMILTNNKWIAKKARYLTTQAKDDSLFYVHNDIGYNYRLNNLQAALGLAQLKKINKYLMLKRKINNFYINQFKEHLLLKVSETPSYAKNNCWLNILEINKIKDIRILKKIITKLHKSNIDVRPIWRPNHLQKMYIKNQKYKLKNVNDFYINRLCLPSSPLLTKRQLDYICNNLKQIII